jgi:regulator of sigma E protease
LFKKKMKSGFLLTFNLLPLGGFVRLKGEHDAATTKGSFGATSLSNKTKIMAAGVLMNLIVAVVLFTVISWMGMPTLVDNQFRVEGDSKVTQQIKNEGLVVVGTVVPGSPAEKAGLRENDEIIAIDGVRIDNPSQVSAITKEKAGQQITVTASQYRDNRQLDIAELMVQLNQKDEGQGIMGVIPISGQEGIELRRSTWSAPIVAVGLSAQFTKLTFQGLGSAITSLFRGDTEKASQQVAGPVGVFSVLKQGSSLGLSFILMIVTIISLTLAIMNVLPIPALDGGRLFVTYIFRAFKKPLTKNTEELIHGVGFMLLMVLFVLITIVDVKRF